jgi:hypothetical protein
LEQELLPTFNYGWDIIAMQSRNASNSATENGSPAAQHDKAPLKLRYGRQRRRKMKNSALSAVTEKTKPNSLLMTFIKVIVRKLLK